MFRAHNPLKLVIVSMPLIGKLFPIMLNTSELEKVYVKIYYIGVRNGKTVKLCQLAE